MFFSPPVRLRPPAIFCGRPLPRFLSAKKTHFCTPNFDPSSKKTLPAKMQFLVVFQNVFFLGQIYRGTFEPQLTLHERALSGASVVRFLGGSQSKTATRCFDGSFLCWLWTNLGRKNTKKTKNTKKKQKKYQRSLPLNVSKFLDFWILER